MVLKKREMNFVTRIVSVASVFIIALLMGCSDDFTDPNDPKFDDPEESGSRNPNVDENTPSDAQPLISNGGAAKWELIWTDEFSGNILDAKKWTRTVSERSRNPRPGRGILDWRWQESHVNLNGDGQVVLSASKVGENAMFCGSIDSQGKFEPTYGFFEARLSIAETAKGNHTAFWLQGWGMGNVDGTGNDGAEVDIFESAWVGNFTKSVVHIDGYGADHKANTKRYDTPGIHEGYHVYGLNWQKDKMEIYYDGELKVTYAGIWVPQVPEWLWVSVGASFGDGDFLSQPMGHLSDAKIDYVRAWKSK